MKKICILSLFALFCGSIFALVLPGKSVRFIVADNQQAGYFLNEATNTPFSFDEKTAATCFCVNTVRALSSKTTSCDKSLRSLFLLAENNYPQKIVIGYLVFIKTFTYKHLTCFQLRRLNR